MTATLSRSDVEQFRALICRNFGLRFEDGKLEFLQDTLRERMHALRLTNPDEYLNAPWSRDERHALARILTVAETYFFRNHEQFRALDEIVIPHFLNSRGHAPSLRVLSAACASGEEAYSLAIALQNRLPEPWSFSVTAIDLNPTVLEKARKGRYSEWSLRGTDETARDRNFHREGTEFVLHDSIRHLVSFEERNLIEDDASFWKANSFDIAFCRNVTMYFPIEITQQVISRIARSLVPGGYLFMGHAETLRGISNDFHLRHTHDTFYYRRKDADENSLPPPSTCESRSGQNAVSQIVPDVLAQDISWVDAIAQASNRIASLAHARSEGLTHEKPPAKSASRHAMASPAVDLSLVLELLRAERFDDAISVLAKFPAESQGDDDVQLLRAVLLTNAGKLSEAAAVCDQLLAADEMNAGAHYLAALCREHAGDFSGAIEHNEAAVYLNSAFAMPHLHLGLVARRKNDLQTARREIELARSLLRSEDASRILLFGGGFSREGLIELCNAELLTLEAP